MTTTHTDDIIIIRPDLHNERPGFYRAFTAASLDADTCCTCIGYCSSGGSWRTQREVIDELRRFPSFSGMEVYSESGRKLAVL